MLWSESLPENEALLSEEGGGDLLQSANWQGDARGCKSRADSIRVAGLSAKLIKPGDWVQLAALWK